MRKHLPLLAAALLPSLLLAQEPAGPWRSTLYPADWQPGFADANGHFLHDFSYAGYGRGERPLPEIAGPMTDVTKPPYAADPSGERDSTSGIQSALDTVGKAGGGVVYLPPGTYRVHPPEGSQVVLILRYDHLVLRGAGANKSFLFNDEVQMREKSVLRVEPEAKMGWRDEGPGLTSTPLAQDLPNQSTMVTVRDVSGFAPGDLVTLRSDLTQRFIDSVDMKDKWQPAGADSANRTLMFSRRLVAVDAKNSTLTLDVPVRYPLVVADLARVVKMTGRPITECGLEDFALGMKQHPGTGTEENDFAKAGTVGYEVHGARAIVFKNAENCWARRLATYAPPGNDPGIHIVSNCLALERSRFVTVRDCQIGYAQYKGGGGNGYGFINQGEENLITHCQAVKCRHNYDFGTMAASGNVISHCLAREGRLGSDFHMFLSMANLLDNVTCEADFLEARYYRPWGGNPIHGVTTTQSVFWNTEGLSYAPKKNFILWSQQFGDGYVIGTRGPASGVFSDDFVEGAGKGDQLKPASLYDDQLRRRRGVSSQAPVP